MGINIGPAEQGGGWDGRGEGGWWGGEWGGRRIKLHTDTLE